MKVLRIIPSMDPSSGGPCQGIRNIIPELEQLDIHNEVVSLDAPSASFLGRDPFTIHALGPAKSSWQYSKTLEPWLAENLHRFDVVIIHALWLYHGFAVQKIISKLKRSTNSKSLPVPRVYVMPHGMLDPYFQKAGERKLKALRNWVYWKFIESKVVNNADAILFTSQAELLLARTTFSPYHPKKEINIGYGVVAPPTFKSEMADAFHEKCPQVKDEPFILFLSRIHEKKGIDHLLEAYSKVREKYKSSTKPLPKLVIAGPGLDSVYGQQMKSTVAESPFLRDSVFFPGMLSGDSKWGAFYECEVFILPSHQENFGIAVVEALATSKPVLISHQVNIWREIVETGAGIVADDNSAGAELLLESWLGLSDVAKQQMGDMALKCYRQNFAIKPAAKRFCELVLPQGAVQPIQVVTVK